MSGNIDVVVIGGGYAGVMAANRLMQRDDVTVTLVNPRANFVERLRLHQMTAGNYDAAVDYREVLHERIRLTVESVTTIDAAARTVALSGGGTVGYDYLIYAVGSGSDVSRVPGAAEFAYPASTLEEARQLILALDAVPATAAVTVVGGGPSGIEVAAELAEQGRTVTLVCGGVLGPYLHARSRRAAAKRMAKLGVTVLDGPDSKVTAVTRDMVHLAGGRLVPSAVTIWTAGFGVADLAARSRLRTDTAGRLLTDETLTSLDDDRILAAGDSAAPSDLPFRMSAYTAGCVGAQAADTVLSRIAGERPAEIHMRFNAMCISLGRDVGIFQFADKSDVANRYAIRGGLGAKVKEFACKSSIKHLIEEANKPGSHSWITDDKHRQQLLAAKRAATPTRS
ncbi:NAD(P)/FAD-dependent oxidoreductase [Nocardia crassostreae]|uniref:NAD(P)/FAD-dependent oxidoreductase n=1 Tax=Nocardia crassostreae TaxID=53428 RepID=UPI000834EB3D|nr:FAD-dependent oxidoreductase [Nocardia crassostreae]